MNKLLVNVVDIGNEITTFKVPTGKSEIHFRKDQFINEIELPNEFDSVWYIENGVRIDIAAVLDIKNIKGNIKIISLDDTDVKLHLGIKTISNNEINLLNEVVGSNNNSDIIVRIVSEEGSTILFKATGYLSEKTSNNNYIEDIKYLNEYPASITCLPELIVLSDDVNATHNMTVGMINEEELFYLESRGIEKEMAKEMIRNSFLLSMKRKEASDE